MEAETLRRAVRLTNMLLRRRIAACAVALTLASIALYTLPRWLAGRAAPSFFEGDADHAHALGKTVSRELEQTRISSFSTGSARFDGEWRFGTAVMAAYGFGQVAARYPEHRSFALAEMDRALDSATRSDARSFDSEAWRSDALAKPNPKGDHAAYLGYLGLALSLRRFVDANSPTAELDESVTTLLAERLEATPTLTLETYPGERYPVDNCAVIAAIALRDRALGLPRRPLVDRFLENARANWIDPKTGLLIQAVAPDGKTAVDAPRGSGTALASYFLSFADENLSRDLFIAARRALAGDVLGFGVVREYSRGQSGRGDIDSGPLVLGWSISAMGFSMGAARAHRDSRSFTELYRSFDLLGAPSARRGELSFVSGGPLGNAIVFAMLTAEPAKRWSER